MMEIISLIVLFLCLLALAAIAFFLFAIWRSILGKSSVDLKLATSIDKQVKRMESLNNNLDSYSRSNKTLSDEAKEIRRYLQAKPKKEDGQKNIGRDIPQSGN